MFARTCFAVIVVLILCLPISNSRDQSGEDAEVNSLDLISVEEISTDSKELYHSGLAEPACDCGPHSTGCKLNNGSKVCECDYKYRQENEECKPFCEDRYQCNNGAPCVNESCQCLPGTSGTFCDKVDECEGMKGPLMCGDPDEVLCWYDSKNQKPYCMCRTYDFIYNPRTRSCIECDCGKHGSCSLINETKTCKCNEGAAIRQTSFWGDIVDRCEICDCGNNSDGCSFEGLYSKVCKCKPGFAQQPDLYGDACNECTCGPHGQCYFKGWYQYCNCDKGYKPFLNLNRTELICKECDCGKNGNCFFKEEVKQCECNPGYALRDGICTACQCYADDKVVGCTFTNKIQTCLCPDGYEKTKFICKDIDECLNSSNSCPPSSTDCLNTIGSYECVCKSGYEPRRPGSDPKVDGCEDVNECEDESLCPRNHTWCSNLPGSYKCECESGYVPVPPHVSAREAGCQKREYRKPEDEPKGWTTALIVLGVLLAALAIVIIAVTLKRRFARTPATMDLHMR